ncbi:endoribonuclease L-PSP [Thermosipho africanus H17ap60334]|uniref:RidA family protein n=1 Tax=Thermosipho africanus TaxID=2421 RepID=UPI00028D71BF|nr:RidA family protein [Thermosipho africanus]EKF50356.1 endoribonuclease L-PSP [Thermosipho africanus H17ap60334]MDK2886522.1 2-iminobutanoate/2-iminopropanoate deaminase [Thermosipho sp. (in: thermotogales)]
MEIIQPKNAPKAIGPYSIAVKSNGFIFVSGQLPVIPETGEMVKGDIKKATLVILKNIKNILEESGSGIEKIVKVNVYMMDISNFNDFNEVYAEFFGEHKPARAVVQVAGLPKNSDLEIEVIAEA